MAVNYSGICFLTLAPGANVIYHFAAVIYCHSMVIVSFSVIKQYTMVITIEWHQIARLKSFITLAHGDKLKYRCNLLWYFNSRKSRVKLPRNFYNIGPMCH
jgi:hypothetical protein